MLKLDLYFNILKHFKRPYSKYMTALLETVYALIEVVI